MASTRTSVQSSDQHHFQRRAVSESRVCEGKSSRTEMGGRVGDVGLFGG